MARYNPADDSDKMRALVQLAASIASPLTKVVTSLAAEADILAGPDAHRHLSASATLLKRDARTLQQIVDGLLEFSGKRPVRPQVLSVSQVVVELTPLLRCMCRPDVAVNIDCAADLFPVFADLSQLERVLCSVVVRSRDTMPDSGTMELRAENFAQRDSSGQMQDFVRIGVSDAGPVIPLLDRLFEPVLMRTCPGLGLGFATVYGAITQMRGQIIVESDPLIGGRVTLLLPAHPEGPPPEPTKADPNETTRPRSFV